MQHPRFSWLQGNKLVAQERGRYLGWRAGTSAEVPFSAEVWNTRQHHEAFDLREARAPPQDPDQAFVCPVCLEILDNPHALTSCDHVFCQNCLDTMGRSSSIQACPLCRRKNPLASAYHTPLSILDAYLRRTYPRGSEPSATEKKALFDQLIPAAERSKALAFRRGYQTWRRKHFVGAKGEFSDVVHLQRTGPLQDQHQHRRRPRSLPPGQTRGAAGK